MDFAAQSKKGAGIARLLRPSFLYPFPRRPLLARSYSQRACRCRDLLLFLLLLSPAGAGQNNQDLASSASITREQYQPGGTRRRENHPGVREILSGVPFAPRSKIPIPTGKDHNPYLPPVCDWRCRLRPRQHRRSRRFQQFCGIPANVSVRKQRAARHQ